MASWKWNKILIDKNCILGALCRRVHRLANIADNASAIRNATAGGAIFQRCLRSILEIFRADLSDDSLSFLLARARVLSSPPFFAFISAFSATLPAGAENSAKPHNTSEGLASTYCLTHASCTFLNATGFSSLVRRASHSDRSFVETNFRDRI